MRLFLFLISVFLLGSCTSSKTSDDNDLAKIDIEEISKSEADSFNIGLYQDTGRNQVDIDEELIQPTAAGRGASQRQWMGLLKNVFQTYGFSNPVYFGVSNRKNIGTILDRRKEIERILSQMVDEKSYESFLSPANSGTLSATDSKDFNINLALDVNSMQIDPTLRTQITRSDSSILLGGSWEIRDLVWGSLKDSVRLSKNPAYAIFASALEVKRNVVISKVLKITGFRSEISTSTDIGAELKAKIDTSIVRLNGTEGMFKFKVSGNRKILVESIGHFYVFAILSKKKL